jgi:hypothetical protein
MGVKTFMPWQGSIIVLKIQKGLSNKIKVNEQIPWHTLDQ